MNTTASLPSLEAMGMSVRLPISYEEARERVTAALKEEGFGVLTEIDVQATFKKKLDKEFRKYAILGACNPNLAYRALHTDLNVGLLLPCNVIVYEDEAGSLVSIVDPLSMLAMADSPGLQPVAQEARDRLGRVVDALLAQAG